MIQPIFVTLSDYIFNRKRMCGEYTGLC